MDIYTVRDNLKNTIQGKELLLAEFKSAPLRSGANLEVVTVMRQILEHNIGELNRILADVEQCCGDQK